MTDEDFFKKVSKQRALTLEEEQSAGRPVEGNIDEEHRNFFTKLISLIDNGIIEVGDPQTFLNQDTYAGLDQEWKDQTDLALINIANQVQLINAFHRDKSFSDNSPQLQTMVDQLWQMKQRIEVHHDVFKF